MSDVRNRTIAKYVGVRREDNQRLEDASNERERPVSAMLFIILWHATDGFTNFSLADKPITTNEKEPNQ